MTVIARKIGPRLFLAGICVAWGIVMLAFGFVQNWYDMAVLRVLLGLFEAGFFPSCVFLISTWYVRHEVAVRIAFFYLFGNVFGGFGGVLAYGVCILPPFLSTGAKANPSPTASADAWTGRIPWVEMDLHH